MVSVGVENPEALLGSPKVLSRIEATCKRWFYYEHDADEAYVFILDKLQENDFHRLRAFKGQSKLTTYLYSAINSLASDFKRKKYGRKRIPKLVSRLGGWAETVFMLLCWRRYSFEDAYESVILSDEYKGTWNQFRVDLEPILDAPCRENPSTRSMTDAEGGQRQHKDPHEKNPLAKLLEHEDQEQRLAAARVIKKVTAEMAEQDQMLIRLVYGSDLSAAAAGRVIGLDGPQARRRLKGVLTRFREALLAEGIRKV